MRKDLTGEIKTALETLYGMYNHRRLIPPDPLQFIYRYSNPPDMEIVGFLSALLAYGRVAQIQADLNRLFDRMGNSPSAFVRDFDRRKRTALKDFKHRFTTGDDISDLLAVLKVVLNRSGSIESCFLKGFRDSDPNIIPALTQFTHSLRAISAQQRRGRVTDGLKYLLTDPSKASACKRLNLFLRWMVRKDDVDPGLWKSIDKAKLIVPVDVHMGRLCGILGFHSGKSISLATAIQITQAFARIEPNDPAKYDFALSRVGIVDKCNGILRRQCESCRLFSICLRRKPGPKHVLGLV